MQQGNPEEPHAGLEAADGLAVDEIAGRGVAASLMSMRCTIPALSQSRQ